MFKIFRWKGSWLVVVGVVAFIALAVMIEAGKTQ